MNAPLQAVSVGDKAPDFALIDDTGAPWQLSKHQGQVVVLYFYPADDTPGCTKQACGLRDNYNAFAQLGATVVGINYNSTKSHQAFKAKHHLPFTLLSDSTKSVAKAYNANPWWSYWFWAMPKRKTIIIDKQGFVRYILNNIDVTTHTDTILDEVRRLAMKKVLLVVAQKDYQPTEYEHTRKELETAGFHVDVASNKAGNALAVTSRNAVPGSTAVDVAITDVDATSYDGIFLIGGSGAMHDLDNQATYTMLKNAVANNVAIGAICISPRILAKAGLLKGKRATGWDGDQELVSFFKQHDVIHTNDAVVTHDNIITATGPNSASDFGKAIVKLLR